MNLPLAPPPGLPLPTLEKVVREALIQDYTRTDFSYLIPLIAFGLISFYALSTLLKWLFPPKKTPGSWQEEYIDPFIGRTSAPLTTTELITSVYEKDPQLAAEVEPLLQELDLVKFSTKKEDTEHLILKIKDLFIQAINKNKIEKIAKSERQKAS